jgi:hypothetical protein
MRRCLHPASARASSSATAWASARDGRCNASSLRARLVHLPGGLYTLPVAGSPPRSRSPRA